MSEIQQAINDAMYAFGYMLACEDYAGHKGKGRDFYSDIVPDAFLRGYAAAEIAIGVGYPGAY